VTVTNANDVTDVNHFVDQVINSYDAPQHLCDSIHAPKQPSVVNLSLNDLRHRLNVLRHKPASEQPGFLLIAAHSIPGYNRLDKLNHIIALFQLLPGYLDLTWKYHDRSAAIMIEFSSQIYSRQAHDHFKMQHSELEISIIDDLR